MKRQRTRDCESDEQNGEIVHLGDIVLSRDSMTPGFKMSVFTVFSRDVFIIIIISKCLAACDCFNLHWGMIPLLLRSQGKYCEGFIDPSGDQVVSLQNELL